MNRFLKSLCAVAVGLGVMLSAGLSAASTGTPAYVRDVAKVTPAIRDGASWSITLAQNAIDTTIVAVGALLKPYVGVNGSNTTGIYNSFTVSCDMSAATDSLNIGIDTGPTGSGPWAQAIAQTNATYSLTLAANGYTKSVSAATIPLAPFWRIRTKAKGSATITAKTVYLWFPTVASIAIPK